MVCHNYAEESLHLDPSIFALQVGDFTRPMKSFLSFVLCRNFSVLFLIVQYSRWNFWQSIKCFWCIKQWLIEYNAEKKITVTFTDSEILAEVGSCALFVAHCTLSLARYFWRRLHGSAFYWTINAVRGELLFKECSGMVATYVKIQSRSRYLWNFIFR